MSRLMDPLRSRALLVGAGSFGPDAQLDNLPAVAPGIDELRRLLMDPDRGGLAPTSCRTILDPASPGEVDAELWRCVEEAEDTFLVYFSGHGVPHPRDGSLHLAVRGTERRRVHATAIPIEWIRDALRESGARAKVIILDCCFSGRAIQAMSAGELAEEVDIAGSFVMTASAANTRALAPEGEPYTAFTGALIDLLRAGVPDAGDYLNLETLFRCARSALRERGFPEPQAQRINEAAQLALARNPAGGGLLAIELPAQLAGQDARTLARIARGRSRHALAAAAALERLARDADPAVAEAAVAASGPRELPAARERLPAEPGWFRTAVFYEIQVPAFLDTDADGVGDLLGVAEKADYLEWLGIDAVILSEADAGLDLLELLDALHEHGLRVISDLPAHHDALAGVSLASGIDGVRIGGALFDADSPAAGPVLAMQPQLAPRILLALAREDHTPISDPLDPAALDAVQWGLSLRDGDALPLDGLTPEEADQMVAEYARNPTAVMPEGLRRRLAPMLDGDQDAIKLAHLLLLTLPGSPVLYYGDELGMGEDLKREGLDAIRTPMQWIGEPGAGFSLEEPEALPVPPVDDPVFGYRSLNVDSQLRIPGSFLRWLRRMLALRAQHPVFGLGAFRPVATSERHVLAFVREHEDDVVLVVANLSRRVAIPRLDLSAWAGRVPEEMLDRTLFSAIHGTSTAFTIGGRDGYLLQLRAEPVEVG